MSSNLLFYTDGPPLVGGHGCHGVAHNIIRSLGNEICMVATRQFRRSLERSDIRNACEQIPLFLCMDASPLGIRRFFPGLATILDLVLLAISMPQLKRRATKFGAERVFFLCGADGYWLLAVKLFQLTGLPVDLYVVDDVERFAVINRYRFRKLMPKLFRHVASRCRRVFAISEGYAEQIHRDHGVAATWLPMPVTESPYLPDPYLPCNSETRSIVYSGALNHLYKDAITDLYEEILKHNAKPDKTYELRLTLISYGNPKLFAESLPNDTYVDCYRLVSEETRIRLFMSSFCCFLPYSFLDEERDMVTTSFSCKIIEYFKSGRPVLVYGPAYASIPRYFIENQMPLTATSRDELEAALHSISGHDNLKTIIDYQKLWYKNHSPQAWTRIINQ